MRKVLLHKEDFTVQGDNSYKATFDPPIRDVKSWRILKSKVHYTPQTETFIQDTAIFALNPLLWIDWSHSESITPNPVSIGNSVMNVVSRTGVQGNFSSSAGGLLYSEFGATKGLSASVAWHFLHDGTGGNNPNEGSSTTFLAMFRTKDALAGWNWLYMSPVFRITIGSHIGGANIIGYYDLESLEYRTTNLVLQPATDFLLIARKEGTAVNWTLKNLGTNTEQTDVSVLNKSGMNLPIFLSNAQTGFQGLKISHILVLPGHTEANAAIGANWMQQKYSGQGEPVNTNGLFIRSHALSSNVMNRDILAPSGRDRTSNIIDVLLNSESEYDGQQGTVHRTSNQNTWVDVDLAFCQTKSSKPTQVSDFYILVEIE